MLNDTSLGDTVLTEAGLRRRAQSKEAVADAMVNDREHCREAWVASGFAVEFSLKALIARREGLDSWPSKQSAPEKHIHNLKQLFLAAGIDVKTIPLSLKPSVRVILDWERRHDYIETTMPRKVAKSIWEAAFGSESVVKWINTLS